ncbi:MAG: hypothetical protein ACLFTE_04300 [Salinivenus sp.]
MWQSSVGGVSLDRILLEFQRCLLGCLPNKLYRRMHHCLKDSQNQVVGFVLDADELGHEIYRVLDWADSHFSSYSVDQSDGRVYVRSDAIEDASDLHTEPLSLGNRTPASDRRGGGGGNGGEAEPVA